VDTGVRWTFHGQEGHVAALGAAERTRLDRSGARVLLMRRCAHVRPTAKPRHQLARRSALVLRNTPGGAVVFLLVQRGAYGGGVRIPSLSHLLLTHKVLATSTARPVADLGCFRGGDFGNPPRTEGVWAYGRISCVCELGRELN